MLSSSSAELWLTTRHAIHGPRCSKTNSGLIKKERKSRVGFQSIIIVKICWRKTDMAVKLLSKKALGEPNATAV